jgi:hypothetical protein
MSSKNFRKHTNFVYIFSPTGKGKKFLKPSAYVQKCVPLMKILLCDIYGTEQYVWHVQHAIVQAPWVWMKTTVK